MIVGVGENTCFSLGVGKKTAFGSLSCGLFLIIFWDLLMMKSWVLVVVGVLGRGVSVFLVAGGLG